MKKIFRFAQDDSLMILCHFSGKPSTTRLNVVNRRSTPEGAKVNESIKSTENRVQRNLYCSAVLSLNCCWIFFL